MTTTSTKHFFGTSKEDLPKIRFPKVKKIPPKVPIDQFTGFKLVDKICPKCGTNLELYLGKDLIDRKHSDSIYNLHTIGAYCGSGQCNYSINWVKREFTDGVRFRDTNSIMGMVLGRE